MENAVWYEFFCPECENVWKSDQPTPDREWCICGSAEEPMMVAEIEE